MKEEERKKNPIFLFVSPTFHPPRRDTFTRTFVYITSTRAGHSAVKKRKGERAIECFHNALGLMVVFLFSFSLRARKSRFASFFRRDRLSGAPRHLSSRPTTKMHISQAFHLQSNLHVIYTAATFSDHSISKSLFRVEHGNDPAQSRPNLPLSFTALAVLDIGQ